MQLFKPSEYLQIAVANAYGLDKLNWNERLSWFLMNEGKLDELQRTAEEPAMFFAATQAWKAFKEGKSSGFPISLDATASGIQLLAVMTGDRKAAELCNVINTGKREDAYTTIYERVCTAAGISETISREDVKKATMTSFYGSTAQPKRVFGEGELLQVFENTMNDSAPFIWYLNKAFLSMWDSTAEKYSWVMPDNFHVHTKVMDNVKEGFFFNNTNYEVTYKVNQAMEQGRSLGANVTHSVDSLVVREMMRRCSYDINRLSYIQQCLDYLPVHQSQDQRKDRIMTQEIWDHYLLSGFLSTRILDYINPETVHYVDTEVIQDLINTFPKKPFQLLTIHDCFRVLPSYGNDLRIQYNHVLHDLGKSNILAYLLAQITGKPTVIHKNDPEMYKEILKSNYSLS